MTLRHRGIIWLRAATTTTTMTTRETTLIGTRRRRRRRVTTSYARDRESSRPEIPRRDVSPRASCRDLCKMVPDENVRHAIRVRLPFSAVVARTTTSDGHRRRRPSQFVARTFLLFLSLFLEKERKGETRARREVVSLAKRGRERERGFTHGHAVGILPSYLLALGLPLLERMLLLVLKLHGRRSRWDGDATATTILLVYFPLTPSLRNAVYRGDRASSSTSSRPPLVVLFRRRSRALSTTKLATKNRAQFAFERKRRRRHDPTIRFALALLLAGDTLLSQQSPCVTDANCAVARARASSAPSHAT